MMQVTCFVTPVTCFVTLCIENKFSSSDFCHGFAVQNRLDTSVLSDGAPTETLSSEAILPSSNDLQRITKDFKVLVSRFVE